MQARLPFELDQRAGSGVITAHGGVPLGSEAFRVSGAAAVLDERVVIKRRQRGLPPAQMAAGLFALWAAGGERLARLCPPGAADGAGWFRGVRRGGAAVGAGRELPGAGRGAASAAAG